MTIVTRTEHTSIRNRITELRVLIRTGFENGNATIEELEADDPIFTAIGRIFTDFCGGNSTYETYLKDSDVDSIFRALGTLRRWTATEWGRGANPFKDSAMIRATYAALEEERTWS